MLPSSRNGVLAGILAAGVLLASGSTAARAQGFFAGPNSYDPLGGWPRFGYNGLGSHRDQGWIGVPGRDAGYDQWRRDADWAYRRGDFYLQGWQQRPYPAYPGSGYYVPPVTSPYWPR